MPLKTGVKALGTATISELRESLHVMVAAARKKAEANPKTVALANLIEEMNPIARKNRNLTVERYCEIKAAQLQKIMR